MKIGKKYSEIWINILISIALSLIVNFGYLVFRLSPGMPVRGMRHPINPYFYLTLQILYYSLLSFTLLTISTAKSHRNKGNLGYTIKLLYCLLVTLVFYFLEPRIGRDHVFMFKFQSQYLFDPMLILKCSFVLIVAVLYGKIYELVYQKQHIAIENEILRNENLQTTYNTLINQINPHFFFNSLNSLAMLVREKHNDKALIYIDQLSDTFRYIIQNGHTGGTTLNEELKFLESYKYLLEIRYADKLFFDIHIDDEYRNWTLPSLTLQPLIENVVKHNIITTSNPLHISIETKDSKLVVSNSIRPKIDPEYGTGIGLKNLESRYTLLTGKSITVTNDGETFSVFLPLTPPQS